MRRNELLYELSSVHLALYKVAEKFEAQNKYEDALEALGRINTGRRIIDSSVRYIFSTAYGSWSEHEECLTRPHVVWLKGSEIYLKEKRFEAAISLLDRAYDSNYLPQSYSVPTKDTNFYKLRMEIFIAWVDNTNAFDPSPELQKLANSFAHYSGTTATDQISVNGNYNKIDAETLDKAKSAWQVYQSRAEDYYTFDSKIHYAHQLENRNHFYNIKYKNQSGDHAKATILKEFKAAVNNCKSSDDLDRFVENLKSDPKYTILRTGQGITTRFLNSIFHIKETSSEQALNKMIAERKVILEKSQEAIRMNP